MAVPIFLARVNMLQARRVCTPGISCYAVSGTDYQYYRVSLIRRVWEYATLLYDPARGAGMYTTVLPTCYAMSGTDIRYLLRIVRYGHWLYSYAVSGTDSGSAGTSH
eukprot:2461400-Rhodomonas_salina.1